MTSRLELVAATLEIVTADLHCRDALPKLLGATPGEGWPPPLIDVPVMQRLKQSLRDERDPQGWGSWYVILKAERTLVGIGGFKSRPRDGAVECGYTVLEAFQQRGIGTEMVAVLVDWAFRSPEVTCVFAETLPELFASQRVLVKNGFANTGQGAGPGVIRFAKMRGAPAADNSATLSKWLHLE